MGGGYKANLEISVSGDSDRDGSRATPYRWPWISRLMRKRQRDCVVAEYLLRFLREWTRADRQIRYVAWSATESISATYLFDDLWHFLLLYL